jgi:hypothetical protein
MKLVTVVKTEEAAINGNQNFGAPWPCITPENEQIFGK